MEAYCSELRIRSGSGTSDVEGGANILLTLECFYFCMELSQHPWAPACQKVALGTRDSLMKPFGIGS